MADYINKAECEKRGFVREADGKFYKLNTLERYGRDGWLDFGDKRSSETDRISAGNRLGRDFYLARLEPVSANDVRKVKVDGHGSSVLPETVLAARDRFNKAMQSVPREFWPVVSRVCCEDKKIVLSGDSERQRSHQKYALSQLLCFGLDRLIEHYRSKRSRKREIDSGFARINFLQRMDKYQ